MVETNATPSSVSAQYYKKKRLGWDSINMVAMLYRI